MLRLLCVALVAGFFFAFGPSVVGHDILVHAHGGGGGDGGDDGSGGGDSGAVIRATTQTETTPKAPGAT